MTQLRKGELGKAARKKAPEILGLKTFTAISAVEGLKLSPKGRKRVAGPLSTTKRRAEVLRAYLDLKGHR